MEDNLQQKLMKSAQAEKASNCYLMSLVAIMAGLGLPIFNLLATLFFFIANRNESTFVKWHCTQALISQVLLFLINGAAIGWLLSIIFGGNTFNSNFFAYIAVVLIINTVEFIVTVYTAIKTRKGEHFEWFFIGPITNMIFHKRAGIHPDDMEQSL